MSRRPDIEGYVEHFRARVLQDALNEATASYWRRRAETFAAALPRAADYPGRVTDAERTRRTRELAETIRACYARAGVALIQDDIEPEVLEALREAA